MSNDYRHDESKHPRDEGGRFTTKPASEAEVVLDPVARAQEIDDAADTGEYVEPGAVADYATGRTREVEGFRDAAALSGEYNHPGGGYPKLAEGVRRRTYAGPMGTLRMPNRTAVIRFGEDTGGTFDFPVSMNGEVSWMRATPGQRGTWEVEPVAGHSADQVTVAESVCAVLEARRPTTALGQQDASALMNRRRERLEARGARQHDIASSWIRSTGYQEQGQMMVMRTKDTWTKGGAHRPGRIYGFRDVPADHYNILAKADRPGAVFNELIKGQHERVAVGQCGSCGAYYSTDAQTAHACTTGVGTTPRPGIADDTTSVAANRLRRLLTRA